jgi:hypothetical protein
LYISPTGAGLHSRNVMTKDLFVQNLDGTVISCPKNLERFQPSQITQLISMVYTKRAVDTVVSTNSIACLMSAMLYTGNEFRITHQEMISVMKKCDTGRNYIYGDQLIIPIIDNSSDINKLKVIFL